MSKSTVETRGHLATWGIFLGSHFDQSQKLRRRTGHNPDRHGPGLLVMSEPLWSPSEPGCCPFFMRTLLLWDAVFGAFSNFHSNSTHCFPDSGNMSFRFQFQVVVMVGCGREQEIPRSSLALTRLMKVICKQHGNNGCGLYVARFQQHVGEC